MGSGSCGFSGEPSQLWCPQHRCSVPQCTPCPCCPTPAVRAQPGAEGSEPPLGPEGPTLLEFCPPPLPRASSHWEDPSAFPAPVSLSHTSLPGDKLPGQESEVCLPPGWQSPAATAQVPAERRHGGWEPSQSGLRLSSGHRMPSLSSPLPPASTPPKAPSPGSSVPSCSHACP